MVLQVRRAEEKEIEKSAKSCGFQKQTSPKFWQFRERNYNNIPLFFKRGGAFKERKRVMIKRR